MTNPPKIATTGRLPYVVAGCANCPACSAVVVVHPDELKVSCPNCGNIVVKQVSQEREK